LELARTLKTDTKTIEKYLYVMRKSYSIALIKPFWSNLRAELTKMPKIFFFDV
jgi:predicted AAA+ superfamily ATPase